MRFQPLKVVGASLVSIERRTDARGFFSRTYCAQEFAAAGLEPRLVQASISYNARRGTVRGLHFQWPPSREGKFVRCVRGAIFDVLLDLRPDSATFLTHCAVQLNQDNRDAVFIPHGVAHGFETLCDDTEVLYQMTDFFAPDLGSGVRWNDPQFGIDWPLVETATMSDRDATYPDFDPAGFAVEFSRRSTGVSAAP